MDRIREQKARVLLAGGVNLAVGETVKVERRWEYGCKRRNRAPAYGVAAWFAAEKPDKG